MITNEEKAEEIAQSFRTARMFSKHPCEIAEDAAKQMAEWKEQQMIEKAVYKCAAMLHKIDDLLRAKGLKGQFENEFDEEYKKFKKGNGGRVIIHKKFNHEKYIKGLRQTLISLENRASEVELTDAEWVAIRGAIRILGDENYNENYLQEKIIKKAIKWIEEHMTGYGQFKYVDDFKKAMMEE